MIILRKFWSDNDFDDREFSIITSDGEYYSLNEEEAFILLRKSLEIVSQLQPLLFSSGIKFYSEEN